MTDGGVQLARPGCEPFSLQQGEQYTIGRKGDIGADWELSGYVSRRQATILLFGQPWGKGLAEVKDASSANGTTLYLPPTDQYTIPQPECRGDALGLDAAVHNKIHRGEDRFVIRPDDGVFGMFDGAGGEAGAAAAADMAAAQVAVAAEALGGTDGQFAHYSPDEAVFWLKQTLDKASASISNTPHTGVTTATVARIVESGDQKTLAWASIGDSRLYVLRGGQIRQMTRDEGRANLLARAMGLSDGRGTVQQMGQLPLLSGDTIILVTDGITGDFDRDVMTDRELALLAGSKAPADAARALVEASRKHDDGTAIVVAID